MKLRYKILTGGGLFLAIACTVLGLMLSHNSACKTLSQPQGEGEQMQAIVYSCYGPPEVLELANIAKPIPADNEVLVKIRAASVNPLDWHSMRGSPYLMRLVAGLGAPDDTRMGVDFAGTVEAVGSKVTRFTPGQNVFGGRGGAFAEYVVVPDNRGLVLLPDNVDFEQGAAVAIAAVTALQALRDQGQLQPGQKVLINGASGGVGTYAVQIAKAMGAEVTGVASTRNLELLRSLGADHVFDYTREDYTTSGEQFDLIIDNVGNHSPLANRRAMTPNGKYVLIGGSKGDWVGPLIRPLQAVLLSPFVDQDFGMMLARIEQDTLADLAELMQTGQMVSVIDRRYPLNETAAAIAYSEEGHARGKIIITIE